MKIGLVRFAKAVAAILVSAAPLGAQRHIVHTYAVADGLPSEHVSCLVSDRDGFLWICTRNGLARFDGSRFVTFGTEDGLPDPVVNNFLHARSGTRWVATNGGGIARIETGLRDPEGQVFTAFPVGGNSRGMRVNVLFESPDGTLLAGTDGGLFRPWRRRAPAASRYSRTARLSTNWKRRWREGRQAASTPSGAVPSPTPPSPITWRLEDIRNTRTLEAVIAEGRLVDRASLPIRIR